MQLEPVLVEGQAAEVVADGSEAMDVARTEAAPIDELDAQLERAAYRAHELDFIDLQRVVEGAQVRNGGLTDAHRADVLGLDQVDRERRQRARERRRRHPAGGSAANDDDVLQPGVVVHELDDDTVRRCAQNFTPKDPRTVRGKPVMLPTGFRVPPAIRPFGPFTST